MTASPAAKDQRPASVSKTGIGDPVAKGGSEGLRKCDGRPVEDLHAWRAHGVHRYCAFRPVPKRQHDHEAGEQEQ